MTHRLPSTLSLARRSASISTLQPSYRASPMKHQLHCEMQKLRGRTSNILLRSLFYVKRSKISVIDRWYPMVPTDGFILDLEDAVPYEKKLETRRHVAGALNLIPPSDFPHILVRMNCLSDDHPDAHWKDDIEQTAHRRLLAYIIPKVRHPEEVQEVSAYLNHCESAMRLPFGHHKLVALIETADGVQKAYDIATSSDRLIAMTVGRFDLLNSLKCSFDSPLMTHACNDVAIAARAANIFPLLSAYCDLDNHSGFEQECAKAKDLGYVGRTALTIKQVQMANQSFMIKEDAVKEAIQVLEGTKHGLSKTGQGSMVGPPHKKQAASLLRRFSLQSIYEKEKLVRMARGSSLEGSMDRLQPKRFSGFGTSDSFRSKVSNGQVLRSPFEITIGDGVRAFWEQHFFPGSKLNTSREFAKGVGFRDILVPFSLLANWAMSLSVMSFSIKAIVHLELVEAVQHLPVYYGDTIINEVTVLNVEQKKQGYDIVTSRHCLLRLQDGETVFSAVKRTMFPSGIFPVVEGQTNHIASNGNPLIFSNEVANTAAFSRPLPGHPVSPGQIYVHDLVKSFGSSDAITLSYYLKGVNPLHINNQLKHEQLLVSGPCVVAAAVSNHGFDFGDVLDEKWSNFRSINKTFNNDLISTVSYIREVQQVAHKALPSDSRFEEVTATVLGVKNINPEYLAKLRIPSELFLQPMRPRDFEAVCTKEVPELSHKVVCVGERTILRLVSQ